MSERRKLSETLSEKERQFLGQEPSGSEASHPELKPEPTSPPTRKKARWVPVTTRLPEELVHQLKMVCREREDAEIEPSTRQDILTDALKQWFFENEKPSN